MKKSSITIGVIGLALLAPVAPTQTPHVPPTITATLTGDVTLIPSNTDQRVKDASRVVVWLSSLDLAHLVRAAEEKQQHFRMVQHNKRFEPSLLVVPVGSTVDFPNLDPWFHNVFSLYQGKRFDLGLYQAGAQKSIRFDRPGPSYLFCNIHPEMTGVILAVGSEFFATSDKAGHYSIAGIPPGKYMLHVWYESATAETLQALERLVVVDSGNPPFTTISIPVTQPMHSDHKNKYGEKYDPDAVKTVY
jgi:plastocyanin